MIISKTLEVWAGGLMEIPWEHIYYSMERLDNVSIFRSWIGQIAGIIKNVNGMPNTNNRYYNERTYNSKQDTGERTAANSNYRYTHKPKICSQRPPTVLTQKKVLTILVPSDSAIKAEIDKKVLNSNQWTCYDPNRYNIATMPSHSVNIGGRTTMSFENAKNFINECRLQLLKHPGLENFGANNNGFGNLGDRNVGNCNIGNGNNGNFNIGNENNGDSNFGNSNSGSYNVGNDNSASYCSGNGNSVNGAVGNNIGPNNKFNYFGVGNIGRYMNNFRFTKRSKKEKSLPQKTSNKRNLYSSSTTNSCSNLNNCGHYSQTSARNNYNSQDSGITRNGLSEDLVNSLRTLKFDENLNAVRYKINSNQPNRITKSGICGSGPDLMVSDKNILGFTTEEAEATILYHIIKGEIAKDFNNNSNLNYKTYSSIMSFPKYVNLGPNIPQKLTIKRVQKDIGFIHTIIDGSTEEAYGRGGIKRPIITSNLNFFNYGATDGLCGSSSDLSEYVIRVVVIDKVLTLPKTVDYVIRNTPSISNFSKIKDFFVSTTGRVVISDKLDGIRNLVGLIEINDSLNVGSSAGSIIETNCITCVKTKYNYNKRGINGPTTESEKLLGVKYSDYIAQNKNDRHLVSETETNTFPEEDSYSYDDESTIES
ncbi:putative PPE family protein PPE13, partial [Smittium culicis]